MVFVFPEAGIESTSYMCILGGLEVLYSVVQIQKQQLRTQKDMLLAIIITSCRTQLTSTPVIFFTQQTKHTSHSSTPTNTRFHSIHIDGVFTLSPVPWVLTREPQWNTQNMVHLNVLAFNIPTMRFNINRLTSIHEYSGVVVRQ